MLEVRSMQLFRYFIASLYFVGLFQTEIFGEDITGDDGGRFFGHVGKAYVGEHVFGYPGNEFLIVLVEVVGAIFDDAFFGKGKVCTELSFVVPAFDDSFTGRQGISFQFG